MNKNKANFRIKHYEYFNKNGKVATEYYYIQEFKKCLWWSYWKDIKHEEYDWGDCYRTRTTFKTLEKAQQFIREVLCPELPRDRSREKIVETITCENE